MGERDKEEKYILVVQALGCPLACALTIIKMNWNCKKSGALIFKCIAALKLEQNYFLHSSFYMPIN